jgi:hypothetical protein
MAFTLNRLSKIDLLTHSTLCNAVHLRLEKLEVSARLEKTLND